MIVKSNNMVGVVEAFDVIRSRGTNGGVVSAPDENKTISDGGITVDFSIIKVHTSN